MTIKKDGTMAVADDFENVTIELTPIKFEPLTDAATEESAAEKLKEIEGYKNIQDWMNNL